MARISASKARSDLAEVLNRVAYKGERILLHRRGKNVAAVVPVEDFEMLQKIEDHLDNEAADKALRNPRRQACRLQKRYCTRRRSPIQFKASSRIPH